MDRQIDDLRGEARDLCELLVEKLIHFAPHAYTAERSGDEARQHEHDGDAGDETIAQAHVSALMRQPAPRTFSMTAGVSLRRKPWMMTSTALLATSSPQP